MPYQGSPGIGGGSRETHKTNPRRRKGTPTNIPSHVEREQRGIPPTRIIRTPKNQRANRKALAARLAAHYKDEYKGVPIGTGRKDDPAQEITRQILTTKRERSTNRKADLGLAEHPRMPHGLTAAVGDLIPDTPAEIALVAATGGAGKVVGAALRARKLARAGEEATKVTKAVEKAPKPKLPKPEPAPRKLVPKEPAEKGWRYADKPTIKQRVVGRAKAKVEARPRPIKAARNAPARAKSEAKALATAEGRKLAVRRTGQNVLAHPVVSATAGLAATHRAGVNVPGGKQADAFLTGTGNAVLHHPGQTAYTTGRAGVGLVTAPASVLLAAGQSAVERNPKPFLSTVGSLAAGSFKMVKGLASGDPKRVEKITREQSGLTPFIPIPAALRAVKESKIYEGPRTAARTTVENVRSKSRDKQIAKEQQTVAEGGRVSKTKVKKSIRVTGKPGEHYILRRTGQKIETHKANQAVSLAVTRMKRGSVAGEIVANRVAKELKKSRKLAKYSEQGSIGDAISVVGKHGLPRGDEAVGKALVDHLAESYKTNKAGDIPASAFTDRHAVKFLQDHPEVWTDKHFWKGLDIFNKAQEAVKTSDRHQYLAQANLINSIRAKSGTGARIQPPEERISSETQRLTNAHDRQGAWDTVKAHEEAAKSLRQTARQEARRAKEKLEPARRKTLRAVASEAESRGGAKVLVGKRDRQILSKVPEYVDAAKQLNQASRDLRTVRTRYGNIARYPSRESADVVRAGVDALHQAERGVEVARQRMAVVKESVQKRAEVEAAKAARGEKASPLAQLGRGPKGKLGHLETRASRTAELAQREREATLALAEARANVKQATGWAKLHDAHVRQIRQSMRGLFDPSKGATVTDTKAILWTPEMVKAFAKDTQTGAKVHGFETPSPYLADKLAKPAEMTREPNYKGNISGNMPKTSSGKLAASGNALSDFHSLVRNSILTPRQRIALNEGMSNWMERNAYQINGKRHMTVAEAEKAQNLHLVPEDTVFMRTQAIKGALTGHTTLSHEEFLKQLKEEEVHGTSLGRPETLTEEMAKNAWKKGEKVIAMPGAHVRQMIAQMEGPKGLAVAIGHVTHATSRTLLNDPGWVLSQFMANNLPLVAALGSNVVHVPGAIRDVIKIQKRSAEDQANIKTVMGSSAGVMGSPARDTLSASSHGIANPTALAAKHPLWNRAWNVINGNVVGRVDRAEQGVMREIAGLAKTRGDYARATSGFGKWAQGARNIFKDQQRAVAEMKGMNGVERATYIAKHPELGARIQKSMNDMGGNWESFTAAERQWAPLTVFYSFLRYSINWQFHTFPLNHPVAATALAFLAEQNSNELERLAHLKPGERLANPLEYAFPVVKQGGGRGAIVYPVGSRITPGLSAPVQAIATGKPAQLTGALTPVAGIAIDAANGVDSFTGQPLKQSRISYVVDQILSLSPAVRMTPGATDLGKAKPGAISKAFSQTDPLRSIRSTTWPYIPMGGSQFHIRNRLQRALKTATDNSQAAQDKLKKTITDTTTLGRRRGIWREINQMRILSHQAQGDIGEILKQLGLSQQDLKQYHRQRQASGSSLP